MVTRTAKNCSGTKIFDVDTDHLKQMGAAVNRAKYFIKLKGRNEHLSHLTQDNFRDYVLAQTQTKFKAERHGQLALF